LPWRASRIRAAPYNRLCSLIQCCNVEAVDCQRAAEAHCQCRYRKAIYPLLAYRQNCLCLTATVNAATAISSGSTSTDGASRQTSRLHLETRPLHTWHHITFKHVPPSTPSTIHIHALPSYPSISITISRLLISIDPPPSRVSHILIHGVTTTSQASWSARDSHLSQTWSRSPTAWTPCDRADFTRHPLPEKSPRDRARSSHILFTPLCHSASP
jgi:hypothetical protein